MVQAKARVTHFTQRMFTREGVTMVALLLGALIVRLPLMTFHGYYGDLAQYVRWGDIVNQDFGRIYLTSLDSVATGLRGVPGGGNPAFHGTTVILGGYINYPPATPYIYGVLVFLYSHIAAPFSHSSLDVLVDQDGLGPFVAKLPLLLADLAAIALLYRQARARHSERFALLAAATYAFSPAVLYNGAIWGQTDSLVALPVLVALFALISERYALGGASLALAVLIKPQPVIFVPLVALYVWRWARREQFFSFVVAGLFMGLLLLLPILYPHVQLQAMLNDMQAETYNNSRVLSSNAFNFWWLIGYGGKTIGSTLFGIKSGLLGEMLFGAVTVICGVQIWRHRQPVVLLFGLAVQLFGFFMFIGGQHERYLLLFIPLALASVIVAQREYVHLYKLIALYVVGTALCWLNMVVGIGRGGGNFAYGQIILPYLTLQRVNEYITANVDALSKVLAFLSLAACLWALHTYAIRLSAQPAGAVSARQATSQAGHTEPSSLLVTAPGPARRDLGDVGANATPKAL